jgi:hypothetical protein
MYADSGILCLKYTKIYNAIWINFGLSKKKKPFRYTKYVFEYSFRILHWSNNVII